MNQKKEELEKRKNYNPDNIFKNNQPTNAVGENSENSDTTTQLVEYKETFFVKLKKFIF